MPPNSPRNHPPQTSPPAAKRGLRALIVGNKREELTGAIVAALRRIGVATRGFFPDLFFGKKISAAEYRARNGGDIDFAAIAAIHGARRGGAQARPASLFCESAYYRRLRAVALAADGVFDDFRPDFVLVKNGFFPVAQIVLARALARGVSPLFWETAIVPGGAYILDARAPYMLPAMNSVDSQWRDASLSPADADAADDFIRRWQSARASKYGYREDAGEVAALQKFIAADKRPAALLALQALGDANVFMQLPPAFMGDYNKWVDAVLDAAPADWKIVVKKHPRSSYQSPRRAENFFHADRVDLHRAFDLCACAITLASNVGMEAALAGRAAIIGGRPIYAGKGITLDLPAAADYRGVLSQKLGDALAFSPPADRLRRFVKRALLDYHFWPGEDEKLRARLAEAQDSPAVINYPQAPFFDLAPRPLRRAAALAKELAALGVVHPPGFWQDQKLWWPRRLATWRRSAAKRLRRRFN
jgi:hypothetical protein